MLPWRSSVETWSPELQAINTREWRSQDADAALPTGVEGESEEVTAPLTAVMTSALCSFHGQ